MFYVPNFWVLKTEDKFDIVNHYFLTRTTGQKYKKKNIHNLLCFSSSMQDMLWYIKISVASAIFCPEHLTAPRSSLPQQVTYNKLSE